MESAWAAFGETVYNTAMECLGPTTRKHKDWFDENSTEIIQLLEDKCHAYRAHLDDQKSTAKKGHTEKHPQHYPTKAVTNARFKADVIQGLQIRMI